LHNSTRAANISTRRDYDGTTALHAAGHAHRHGAAQLLLDRRPSLVGAATPYGETALHVAAREGAVQVAQLLVARGADGQARNRAGRTPCDLARRHGGRGSDEMVALLEAAESGEARARKRRADVAAYGFARPAVRVCVKTRSIDRPRRLALC
jgi:ankyrin repeat protein